MPPLKIKESAIPFQKSDMSAIFEKYEVTASFSSFFRVDPSVGTTAVKETPIELAAKKESEKTRTELLTLFAEFVELPQEIKIKLN